MLHKNLYNVLEAFAINYIEGSFIWAIHLVFFTFIPIQPKDATSLDLTLVFNEKCLIDVVKCCFLNEKDDTRGGVNKDHNHSD